MPIKPLKKSTSRNQSELAKRNAAFTKWEVVEGIDDITVYSRSKVKLMFTFQTSVEVKNVDIGLVLRDYKDNIVFSAKSSDTLKDFHHFDIGSNQMLFEFRLPIRNGDYEVDIAAISYGKLVDQWVSPAKLRVVSVFDSTLTEDWLGIISEESNFMML